MGKVSKRKKRTIKPTERTLEILWRKVVLAIHKEKCFFCGKYGSEHLEAHHIIRCSVRPLSWDWKNGIAVCCVQSNRQDIRELTGTCHRYAHRKIGENEVREKYKYWDYLVEKENILLKDITTSSGITSQEFRQKMHQELKDKLKGVEFGEVLW